MKHKILRNYIVALGIITGFCLATLAIRNKVENDTTYNFLLWNLFLAFVPLAVAWVAYFFMARLGKVMIFLLAASWLLFYPNAPYMISDMIHVNNTSAMVLYDALILFMYAMLALFYGFCSLKIMHLIFRKKVGTKAAHWVVGGTFLLSAAGIYLGRILRLNSWDLFTHPLATMKIIFNHLFPVTKNPATYVVIFLFSIVQAMLWLMMKDLEDIETNGIDDNAQAGRLHLIASNSAVSNEQ